MCKYFKVQMWQDLSPDALINSGVRTLTQWPPWHGEHMRSVWGWEPPPPARWSEHAAKYRSLVQSTKCTFFPHTFIPLPSLATPVSPYWYLKTSHNYRNFPLFIARLSPAAVELRDEGLEAGAGLVLALLLHHQGVTLTRVSVTLDQFVIHNMILKLNKPTKYHIFSRRLII